MAETHNHSTMKSNLVSKFSHRLGLPLLLGASLLPAGIVANSAQAASGDSLVYVGTYTRGQSKGIYAYKLEASSGTFTSLGLVGETPNPSFLAVDPSHRFLYAANELNTFEGKRGASVTAFSLDSATGKLTQLNAKASGGAGACHLVVDNDTKNLLVANYVDASVEDLSILPDGSLGAAPSFIVHTGKSIGARQAAAHAHCMVLDAANQHAYVCDLGQDKVIIYKFDSKTGTLTPNDPPSANIKTGSGPRHMALSPDGRQAYVVSEMGSIITHLSCDPKTGALADLQTMSLLPEDFKGTSNAAEIAMHPSGKYVYATNRGNDSVAVFAIDPASGSLSFVQRIPTNGRTPRGMAIDPTGKFLLTGNQDSSSITVFNLDPATGKLTQVEKQLEAPLPVCIIFVPLK